MIDDPGIDWNPAFYPPGRPAGLDLLVRMAGRGARPRAIACATKRDGGGSQIHAQMSARAFCAAHGYTYAHLPLGRLHRLPDPAMPALWEARFGLGADAPLASDIAPVVPLAEWAATPRLWRRPAVVAISTAHAWTDRHPAAWLAIRDDLRRRYTGPSAPRADSHLRISVHVRRGDVDHAAHPHRYTASEDIQERVVALQRELHAAGREAVITLHSQGDPDDFADMAALGCALDLDGDPLATLDDMIRADVLLTAKSSFSHIAALLSRGLVVHEPYWHSPLPGWLSIDDLDDLAPRLAALP